MIEEQPLLKDKVIKKIFTDKDLIEYQIMIICAAFGFDRKDIVDLKIIDPKVSNNIKSKDVEMDIGYETNDKYINIEINYNKYKELFIKNDYYICNLIIRQRHPGESYKDLKKVYQLNIDNFDCFNANKFIYKSMLMETSLHKLRDDLVTIVDVNLAFLIETDYNIIRKEKDRSLEKLLYIFICKENNILDDIYKNDEIMEKVREKLSDLDSEFNDGLYYNRQELLNRGAFDEGKKETIKEVAEKMLEESMDEDLIIELLGITKEELTEIKAEIETSEN